MVQLEFISSQRTFVVLIKCGNDAGIFFLTPVKPRVLSLCCLNDGVSSLPSQVDRGVLIEKDQISESERFHSSPGSATFLLTLEELLNLPQTQFPFLTNRKCQE